MRGERRGGIASRRRAGIAVLAALLAAALLAATIAAAEVVQKGGLRVSFEGSLAPKTLPRHGSAPVSVSIAGSIDAPGAKEPPQLRTIAIAINRLGRLDTTGVPRCALRDIQPATTQKALEACRSSLVGTGGFSARVLLPEQAPFPSKGEVYAFNGAYHGQPAILAHVYGTEPAPTSVTLPFLISQRKGTFGTVLTASLPQVTTSWGYVTGLSLSLTRRGYLSASCPAPKGFPGAVFPLAKASFGFAGGKTLSSTLTRSCRARG